MGSCVLGFQYTLLVYILQEQWSRQLLASFNLGRVLLLVSRSPQTSFLEQGIMQAVLFYIWARLTRLKGKENLHLSPQVCQADIWLQHWDSLSVIVIVVPETVDLYVKANVILYYFTWKNPIKEQDVSAHYTALRAQPV